MHGLNDYTNNGTIHIVTNNLLGFTTPAADMKSSLYSTGIAKASDAPIFHVNGEAPEEIDWVSRFAVDFRHEFKDDAFVDIVGYRKYGHNEVDDPTYTNPILYQKIRNHTKVSDSYTDKLVGDGVIDMSYNIALMNKIK
jgi:2-oxoglutarate dehydrogenase E1 component